MAQQLSEPKEYKYAIIIDGVAYVLTEQPSFVARSEGRVRITCGDEFEAMLPPSSTYVLIPYEDWLAANGPGSWKRALKG